MNNVRDNKHGNTLQHNMTPKTTFQNLPTHVGSMVYFRKYNILPHVQGLFEEVGITFMLMNNVRDNKHGNTLQHNMTPKTTFQNLPTHVGSMVYFRKYNILPHVQGTCYTSRKFPACELRNFRSFNDTHNPIYFRQLHSKETIGSGAVIHVVY